MGECHFREGSSDKPDKTRGFRGLKCNIGYVTFKNVTNVTLFSLFWNVTF